MTYVTNASYVLHVPFAINLIESGEGTDFLVSLKQLRPTYDVLQLPNKLDLSIERMVLILGIWNINKLTILKREMLTSNRESDAYSEIIKNLWTL